MYTFHCRRLLLEKMLGNDALEMDIENPTVELELIANMGLDKTDITDDILDILKKNTDIFLAPLLGAIASEIRPEHRQLVFKTMIESFRDQVANDYWARDTAETIAEYVAGFFPYAEAQKRLGGKEAVEKMFIKPEETRAAEEKRMEEGGEGYSEEELEDVGEPELSEVDKVRKTFDLPTLIGRRPGRAAETPAAEEAAEAAPRKAKPKKPETEVGFEEQVELGIKMQAIVEDVLGDEAIHFDVRPFGTYLELVPSSVQALSTLKKLRPDFEEAGLQMSRVRGTGAYRLTNANTRR